METYVVPMYVEANGTPQGWQVGASAVMRFDQVVRTLLANLHCRKGDGTLASVAPRPTFTIIEPYGGCFAICQFTIDDGWLASWKAAQGGKSLIADEALTGATVAQLRARMTVIADAVTARMDQFGVPAAPRRIDRILGVLRGLNLTGHHAGFEVVRQSYLSALTDPPTLDDPIKRHHWMHKPPFVDGTVVGAYALRLSVMKAMSVELEAAPHTAPHKLMHYAYALGELVKYLDP